MSVCPITGARSEGKTGACPVGINPVSIDIDEIDERPTVTEYKKLKRVMVMITKFYRDGTDLKRGHFEEITEEIAKLDVDLGMVLEQMAVLTETPEFVGHPKQKEHLRGLEMEKTHLTNQRVQFVTRQKEYEDIYKWSQGIVEVCEWLMLNLDEYCHKTIGYPETASPLPHIDEPTARTYCRGLDEITHNLGESQDFFSASVDGRLDKFHQREKAIIEAQLQIVRKYPETNDRRRIIEAELLADLNYVEENMSGPGADMNRREKMLAYHSDFFKVLKYHKEKLKALCMPGAEDEPPREYDPRYNIYNDL